MSLDGVVGLAFEEGLLEGNPISEWTGKNNPIGVILSNAIVMVLKVAIQFDDALSLMAVLYLVALAFDQRKGHQDIGYLRKL